MTTIRQLRDKVRKWRKTGKSFAWISAELGISKPEARRLENPGHIPGLKVQQQLGILRGKPAWVKEAVQNLKNLLEQKTASFEAVLLYNPIGTRSRGDEQ